MTWSRRALLSGIPAWLTWPTLAAEAPPMLAAYERDTGGRIGLYAENLVTRRKIAWRAHERFVMCSTFKASLAALVLARVDRGREGLQEIIRFGPEDVPDWHAPVARKGLPKGALSVSEMCAAAVEYSDNTCANLLLARVGGPPALNAFWRSIGDQVTRLDHDEPVLNQSRPGDPQDTTTPAAMATNVRQLLLGRALSLRSRGRLTEWMLNCKTGAERLRAGLPGDWRIADKTGNNGEDAASDIALTWPGSNAPVVISAYTQGGVPSPERLARLFAEIGRTVALQLA